MCKYFNLFTSYLLVLVVGKVVVETVERSVVVAALVGGTVELPEISSVNLGKFFFLRMRILI